jgi:hypothetical protein
MSLRFEHLIQGATRCHCQVLSRGPMRSDANRMHCQEICFSHSCNGENKHVYMPGSRRVTMCRSMFPCRMAW